MISMSKEKKLKWVAELVEEREDIIHGEKVTVKVYGPPKAYMNNKPVDDWFYQTENEH